MSLRLPWRRDGRSPRLRPERYRKVHMKRFFKYLLIGLASLAVLFFGASAAAFFLLDVDGLVNRQVQELTPKIEQKLGRKVSVGKVETAFFPTLSAKVSDIKVAGAPGENDLVDLG